MSKHDDRENTHLKLQAVLKKARETADRAIFTFKDQSTEKKNKMQLRTCSYISHTFSLLKCLNPVA